MHCSRLRPSALLGLLVWAAAAHAQSHYIPADAYHDIKRGPVMYIENKGQALRTDGTSATSVKYYTRGANPTVFACAKSSVSLVVDKRDTITATPDTVFSVAVSPVGPYSRQVDPIRVDTLPPLFNFYRPDIAPGITDIRATSRLIYPSIYANIDWHFYVGQSGVKSAFVCMPGSDPTQIVLQIDGADSLNIDVLGDLRAYIKGRYITLKEATAYQMSSTGVVVPLTWTASYVHSAGSYTVKFTFGTYNHTLPLVLQIGPLPMAAWEAPDPRNMRWSTYAGSDDADEFMATDVDKTGDDYVCGYAYESHFPINTGHQLFTAQQADFMGSMDAVVMKFKADNKQISWATFLGGSGTGTSYNTPYLGLDQANDMAVYKGDDPDLDYVFVTGSTNCTDFPMQAWPDSPFANADQTHANPGVEQSAWLAAYTQYDGHLDWCTAHPGGQVENFGRTNGLMVDVDEDGTLIWGGQYTDNEINISGLHYPYVTPTGAYTHANGGGFFTLFDPDYQIKWSTPFGGFLSVGGVYDGKIVQTNNGKEAFITGTTGAIQNTGYYHLDTYQPPNSTTFYQDQPGGGTSDAYVAELNLDTYHLDYCTYWGGNDADFGIAVEVVRAGANATPQVWIGGVTYSSDLDSIHLPNYYSGSFHDNSPGGDADGFLLNFDVQPEMFLYYGTLLGGAGPDAVLDLEASYECEHGPEDQCKMYITGETGSSSGILVANDDPALYRQNVLGNEAGSDRRDAFVLGLGQFNKTPVWSTYYGGFSTDKGWGLAAGPTELFLVGGTVSDQTTFPLKEFSTTSDLDWYDGDLSNNATGMNWGFYPFSWSNFSNPFGSHVPLEFDIWNGFAQDAFITSFGISGTLGVNEVSTKPEGLQVTLVDPAGLWNVTLPGTGRWTVRVYDPAGKLIETSAAQSANSIVAVDLRPRATGVYAVTCIDAQGHALSTKLMKP